MPHKRRKYKRQLGERRYRKLFVIVAEGKKTEPQYFVLLNRQSIVKVECLSGKNSSPKHVLKKMEDFLEKESLKKSDKNWEAWIVVDKDQWTDEQLMQLYEWSRSAENYGLAVSNPKFEYWLLLHFEKGDGVGNSHDCSTRLKKWLPNFDSKGITSRDIDIEKINSAISLAESRDNQPSKKWPVSNGSTVYKLVTNIMKASEEG